MKSFFIVHELHKPHHSKVGDFLYRASLNKLKSDCRWRGSVMFSIYKKFKKHRDL